MMQTYTRPKKKRRIENMHCIRGAFINLSQTMCHSLRADSWIMSSWRCRSYHCHRTKLIHQFKPMFFIDLNVASLGDGVMNAHCLTLIQFVRNIF